MDCAAEEAEVRRALEGIAGIDSLVFRLGERLLEMHARPEAVPQALKAIEAAGMKATMQEAGGVVAAPVRFLGISRELLQLGVALMLALGAEALSFSGASGMVVSGAQLLLSLAAIALAGLETYKKGLRALAQGRLNINALMSVAVTGAFAIGEWPEAATVMALYAIAELIEARAVDRARNAIKTLLALAPEEAEVRRDNGVWETIPSSAVALGAVMRVRPGARLALDGRILSGTSAINQAPVTGESLPVDRNPGDAVFAGTINQTGELEVEVTALASNSTIARIIHAVEQAQGSRAPTQRFVDRFAAIYTPAVFFLALGVVVGAPLLLGWTWMAALYKALVLLVVACPCALVISTPVTIVSALASAARRGILIKGGAHLERVRKLAVIALDKTGTVTEGKPELVHSASPHSAEALPADVLVLALSLAARSDHPVSQAIASGLPQVSRLQVSDFTALAGRGVQGVIDGSSHVLGNHRLIEERGLCGPVIEALLREQENQGRTVTLLASTDRVLAIFAVADTIKDSSREAIASLHALGVATIMLTGDNEATANTIAAQAGINSARGNLLPEDKLDAIRELQAARGSTGMVGDGINDAPALAAADVGIAMGAAGTDTAIEAADLVVMNDDLRRLPEAVVLSRRTHAVLLQNISLAIGIKAVFLVLTILGSTSMWMAVFADMGASLLVVGNGLRLLSGAKAP
ncbi:MAG: heavy metal translocating P-type ATPase [Steroidobacteraceae bacterium]